MVPSTKFPTHDVFKMSFLIHSWPKVGAKIKSDTASQIKQEFPFAYLVSERLYIYYPVTTRSFVTLRFDNLLPRNYWTKCTKN